MIALVLVAGLLFEAEVERLGHPAAQVRYLARVALARAGERAVPALRRGLEAGDPEVRSECARLLDRLALQSLEGERRNEDYIIPTNRMTGQIRKWRRMNVQVQMLMQPRLLRHYEAHYRGVLQRWRNPTLADYNRLLVALADWMSKVATMGGVDRFEALLAARAIAWRLGTVDSALVNDGHWTTRWLVRRRLLPSIRVALKRRGATMTRSEADLLARVGRHVRPLCDRWGRLLLDRVQRRLSPQ